MVSKNTVIFAGFCLTFPSLLNAGPCPPYHPGVQTAADEGRIVRFATASSEPLTSEPESIEIAEVEAGLAARLLLGSSDGSTISLSGIFSVANCFDGNLVYATVAASSLLSQRAEGLRHQLR